MRFGQLWGCPRFSGQRRRPQAGDVDQKNVVQPQVWGLGFQGLGFGV